MASFSDFLFKRNDLKLSIFVIINFFNGTIPASFSVYFCIFRMSHCSGCTWDSNPGQQDESLFVPLIATPSYRGDYGTATNWIFSPAYLRQLTPLLVVQIGFILAVSVAWLSWFELVSHHQF